MKEKKLAKPVFRALAVALFWVAVWYIASFLIGKELLLPSPVSVIKRLGSLLMTWDFYAVTAVSLVRVLLGIVSATVAGVLFAVVMSVSKTANAILSPFITVIKSTPVASFIILALVWLDRSALPIFISHLMVLPVVLANVKTGISEVDTHLVQMAEVFGAGKIQTVRKIYVPSVFPYFSSAVKTSLGLAWKAGIAAEVLAMPQMSIGKKLFEAKAYLETTDLFAWTLVVILLSIVIEFIIKAILTRITLRKGANRKCLK